MPGMNASRNREVAMKKKVVIGMAVLLLFVPGMTLAEVPHQVGGFVLDKDIKAYEDKVIMDTALPVRYAENIEEVEIKFTRGFKSGLIAYGTCARPGNIIRIKLKYADSSKQFYKDLLKRFKKRFGEPDAVKITDTTLIEEDLLCYKNKQLDYRERLRQREWKAVKPETSGWELFLPH
jgi:hypothetical protein